MTKEMLEAYTSMKAETEELKLKIMELKDSESIVDSDVIRDYRSGMGIPKTITGVNMKRYWRLRDRYQAQIETLTEKCSMVEEYIETIEDSVTRRIFRLVYMEGKTQAAAASVLHMDRSVISRKINSYIRERNRQDGGE